MTTPGRDATEAWWALALAVNAAFKGLLGSAGESGHICARTVPVTAQLDCERGWPHVLAQAVDSLAGVVEDGDVVVLADKVVAAALGRIGPRAVIGDPDPKTVPAEQLPALAERWSKELGITVEPVHLLLADEYRDAQATLGTDAPNQRCAEVAAAVSAGHGVSVDVAISDTDTGLDIRRPLIGTPTIGATPIGATAGLTLYEAMRCAVAAEFTRGHTRGVPLVVCKPADRRRRRADLGEARPYPGALDAGREERIAHA